MALAMSTSSFIVVTKLTYVFVIMINYVLNNFLAPE